jgi:hypothetical protein
LQHQRIFVAQTFGRLFAAFGYRFVTRNAFTPDANACSNARETTVFPTEVSVPVIKKRFSITNSTVML